MREGKIPKATLLGFEEGQEPNEVKVTVEKNGRSKTFALDHEKTPSLRQVISGHAEQPPSDAKFHEIAEDVVMNDIFPSCDVRWETRWSRPSGG